MCAGQTNGPVVLTGGPFIQYRLTNTSNWIKPTIWTGGDVPIGPDYLMLSGCTDYSLMAENTVQSCDVITIDVYPAVFPFLSNFQVVNPGGNGACAQPDTTPFLILPAPFISSASPNALCRTGGPMSVTLTGSFYNVNSMNAKISVDGGDLTGIQWTNCTSITPSTVPVQWCQIAIIQLAPPTTGDPTMYYQPTFTISSPNSACSTMSKPVAIFPPPIINPTQTYLPAYCPTTFSQKNIYVDGSYYVMNGNHVHVQLSQAVPDNHVNPNLCTPVAGYLGNQLSVCKQLAINIPNSNYVGTGSSIMVSGPDPMTCSATSTFHVVQEPLPSFDMVNTGETISSTTLCRNKFPYNITLSNSVAGTRVFLSSAGTFLKLVQFSATAGGQISATSLGVSDCVTNPSDATTQLCGSLVVRLPASASGTIAAAPTVTLTTTTQCQVVNTPTQPTPFVVINTC